MDDAAIRKALVEQFEDGHDPDEMHEIYHEDAVLEFPQSGERFIGKQNFLTWRKKYPAEVDYRLRRITGHDDLWVVELLVSYNGSAPIMGVGIMQFRGDRIAHETIYAGAGFERAAWRVEWSSPFDPLASVEPSAWRDGVPFGLDSERPGRITADEATTRAELVRHWDYEGVDFDKSHEIYHDDAILEFPQSGERFVGKNSFLTWRRKYPAKLDFRIRRFTNRDDLWVTENLITYDGGEPMFTLNILQFRDDRIAREYIYVLEGFDAADWRSEWSTPFDRLASVAPTEWREGIPFGLESERPRADATPAGSRA